jgi:NAD(P)-dependent dehydrogenase (short-subunit alcohol dehydrogenase family)
MTGILAGRRILITGAAGGMGGAIARRFAAEGARLALLDARKDSVLAAAEALGCFGHDCNVASPDEVDVAVGQAIAVLGGLDGIVNAAGIYVPEPFEQVTFASWERSIAINLTGPFNLIHRALDALKAVESATIVNIASINSFTPLPATSSYSASKGGLLMLTKCLALELGPKIRSNAICPGVIQTEMTRHISADPEYKQTVANRVALKRLGQPEEIAEAALYLTSAASSFVTGTEIVIDGGFTWH